MREILFKAKWLCNGKWIMGGIIERDGKAYIVGISKKLRIDGVEVDPNTICQYTGLTDKNGNMIYENDVVKVESGVIGSPFMNGMIGKIIYTECAFFIEPKAKTESRLLFDECAEYEVIGDIFDNPELLDEEGD